MKAKLIHECIHVLDIEKSLDFYDKALGFQVRRQRGPEDGSWGLWFIGNDTTEFELELTWNRGRTEPYNNGSDDTHFAVEVDNFEEAHALHESMGCIVYENHEMGLYFITDPDDCWIEILSAHR